MNSPIFSCFIWKNIGCERESSVSMWIYVFLGNVLRGVGETPVQPLGISYIDDYAQSENAALFIGKAAFPLACTSRFGVDQDRFYLFIVCLV